MIVVYMYAAKALSNKVNRFWTTNRKQKVLGAKKILSILHRFYLLINSELCFIYKLVERSTEIPFSDNINSMV